MVTKELSEAAVEFNCILEYTSEELKNKIPQKFLDFLKNIQSQTYKFEYDKTKKLNEQNLKSKTRGLIALVYQDYICNENEKEEYIKKSQEIIMKKEEEKRNIYNPDNVFKSKTKSIESNLNEQTAMIEYKKNSVLKIIKKFLLDILKIK